MKSLIVEDDFTCRMLLQELLKPYGGADIAVDGKEAIAATRAAHEADEPYDLICLDIMMPKMDGQEALVEIRRTEREKGYAVGEGSKILMTTALSDKKNVMKAFHEYCDGYIIKPIDKRKFISYLKRLELIEEV